jgi:hypothetical protein
MDYSIISLRKWINFRTSIGGITQKSISKFMKRLLQYLLSKQGMIVSFFVINVLLKSLFIQSVPATITYDELFYATEAQSLLASGSDSSGNWKPWRLEPSHSMYAELSGVLLVPSFVLFSGSPILAMKSLSILFGSILVISLGLLALRVSQNLTVMFSVLLVSTLNPWIFQFSRMSFDSLYSVTLYTVGLLWLLSFKNWHKLWSAVPFLLAFFQYQGHKPLLLVFACLGLVFLIIENRHQSLIATLKHRAILPALVVLVFAVTLTGFYLIRLPALSSSARSHEFSLFSSSQVAERVNYLRRLTLANPITDLVFNKYSIGLQFAAWRYFNSYDLSIVFINGNDLYDTFALTNYGFLHLSDLVLLGLGLILLTTDTRLRNSYALPISIFLAGGLPNAIRVGDEWLTFRGAFVYIGLALIAGLSLGYVALKFGRRHKIALFLIYIATTLVFFFQYFFHYPVTLTRSQYFYERVLASYISRQAPDSNQLVYSGFSRGTFDMIATYNRYFLTENIPQINLAHSSSDYRLNKLVIAETCPPDKPDLVTADTVVAVSLVVGECNTSLWLEEAGKVEISSPIDSGSRYTIYNDSLCSQYDLPRYPHITKNVFAIEQLSDQEFCESFFTQK